MLHCSFSQRWKGQSTKGSHRITAIAHLDVICNSSEQIFFHPQIKHNIIREVIVQKLAVFYQLDMLWWFCRICHNLFFWTFSVAAVFENSQLSFSICENERKRKCIHVSDYICMYEQKNGATKKEHDFALFLNFNLYTYRQT